MPKVKVCCNAKGPIIIDGEIEITDKYGRPLGSDKKKKMNVMCGCGKSASKPFCDGSHNAAGESDDD
jgi:CDGSH-type Zn-finger protein